MVSLIIAQQNATQKWCTFAAQKSLFGNNIFQAQYFANQNFLNKLFSDISCSFPKPEIFIWFLRMLVKANIHQSNTKWAFNFKLNVSLYLWLYINHQLTSNITPTCNHHCLSFRLHSNFPWARTRLKALFRKLYC